MTPDLAVALRLPVLPADERNRLLAAAQAGDAAARERIILHSLRLVLSRMRIWCAWLDHVTGDSAFEDVLHEGAVALDRAVDHYDAARGGWTTCAVWWIDEGLRHYTWGNIGSVRTPSTNGWRRSHADEVGRAIRHIRLNQPLRDRHGVETDSTGMDHLEAPDAIRPAEAMLAITALLDRLKPQDRWLIQRKFLDLATLNDISLELGVTKERVRQKIEIAVGKLLKKARSPLKPKEFLRLWAEHVSLSERGDPEEEPSRTGGTSGAKVISIQRAAVVRAKRAAATG